MTLAELREVSPGVGTNPEAVVVELWNPQAHEFLPLRFTDITFVFPMGGGPCQMRLLSEQVIGE